MIKTSLRLLLAAVTASLFISTSQAAVETYAIDAVHSSIGFSIRHFVSKVPGSFTKFGGTLVIDRENIENSSVEATIDPNTIFTANEKRDAHLKNPDFFDTAQFPTVTFKSKSWKKTGENTSDVTGDLTMHGVTKEVVLKVTSLGFGPGAKPGSMLSGWEGTTTIKKSDFGLSGPSKLSAMLGDEVNVVINLEGILKS